MIVLARSQYRARLAVQKQDDELLLVQLAFTQLLQRPGTDPDEPPRDAGGTEPERLGNGLGTGLIPPEV